MGTASSTDSSCWTRSARVSETSQRATKRHSTWARILASLATLALVFSLSAGAWAQGYDPAAVALVGDTAPGTGGGVYTSFGFAFSMNGCGDVVFYASVAGGTATEGVFVNSRGTDTAVALPGDTAPGTGGATYSSFLGSPSINDSGDVAFAAILTGGTVAGGVFVDSGGTATAVALVGDTAPGTGGGIYSAIDDTGGFLTINNSGDVRFRAFVTGGSTPVGLFVDSDGPDRAVALQGDVAPGTGGGTYLDLVACSMNASGDVPFFAFVSGSTAERGIFVDSGGTDTAVALPGDVAPGTGGGTYSDFGTLSKINDSGAVAFFASVAAPSGSGIFVDSGGTDTAVARLGDTAPGTGGGTYSSVGARLFINGTGNVALSANVIGGTGSSGIFVTGIDKAVVFVGDGAPGTGGGTYSSLSPEALNDSDHVLFTSNLTGGSVSSGIFAAIPSSFVQGDANRDGVVDGADYTVWADGFGMALLSGPSDGDFNCDGEGDLADYTIWADNVDVGGGTAAGQAPACGLGFELALVLTLLARRRANRGDRLVHRQWSLFRPDE